VNKFSNAFLDDYRERESDIIIASLTCGNSNGDIGLMGFKERIATLLSRARNGMIIIGNADTLQKSLSGIKAWNSVLDSLRDADHFYDGLPVKCESHPTRIALLKTPADFDRLVPNGGCSNPW
jgi:hypothetical protein